MAKTPDTTDQLVEVIAELRDEVRVLRDTVDELRDHIQWAVNNGRLTLDIHEQDTKTDDASSEECAEISEIVPPVQERIDRSRLQIDTILQGDCVEGMKTFPDGCADLVFADPPFNIGYDYDQYDDRLSPSEYLQWSCSWIAEAVRVLKPTGTLWVAIGDEYAAEIKAVLHQQRLACRNWVIWYYTFGMNCQTKFSRSHTHLLYMVKDPQAFTFNPEEIRVPSARQLDGDKRAHPDGRIPDDTWILRPKDIPDSFQADEDTWHIPRVNGTFREREGWHTCQMPEQILARIIRTCTNPRDVVLDPFVGSGTTPTVAKKLGRRFLGFELSGDYWARAQDRINAAVEEQPIEGTDEPFAPKSPRKSDDNADSRQQGLW